MSPGDERGRGGHHSATGRNAQQITPATATTNNTCSGLEVAIRNAEPGFLDAGLELIEMQVSDGSLTCGCRLTEHDWIGEADHSCRWGALFATAARRGLIERVGYHSASRSSRHAGVHAQWRGVGR